MTRRTVLQQAVTFCACAAVLLVTGCRPDNGGQRATINATLGDSLSIADAGASIDMPPLVLELEGGLKQVLWSGIADVVREGSAHRQLVVKYTTLGEDGKSGSGFYALGGGVVSWTAAADRQRRLWIVWTTYVRGSGHYECRYRRYDVVTGEVEVQGLVWKLPRQPGHPTHMMRVDVNSLAFDDEGHGYLVVRPRMGKVPDDFPLKVFRTKSDGTGWEHAGDVPKSTDICNFSSLGFDAREAGDLAVAYVSNEGSLRVYRSLDGGTSWRDLSKVKKPSRTKGKQKDPRGKRSVRDRMPDVQRIGSGIGVAWGRAVSVQTSVMEFEARADTLFAVRAGKKETWGRTLRLNEQRAASKTRLLLSDIQKSSTDHIRDRARQTRPTSFRSPDLLSSESGRLAIVWRDFRDDRLVLLAAVSDDGGLSWSSTIELNPFDEGDVHAARGMLSPDGQRLYVAYSLWSGQADIVAPRGGFALKVYEVVLE